MSQVAFNALCKELQYLEKAQFEASKQASIETIQRLDGNIFELDGQIFELQAYLEEMEIILNMEKERAENGENEE